MIHAGTGLFSLLLVPVLVLLPAGMGYPGAAAQQSSEPVRLSGVSYLGDLPTFVADREGLFAQAGTDILVDYQASGAEALDRLRAGQSDFALTAVTPLVLDRLTREYRDAADEPVILASLVHSSRLNRVMVPAQGPVQEPTDLPGRRVGLARGTNAEYLWWLFAHVHGIDPFSVELIDQPVATIPRALADGHVDAAVIWEPWASALQAGLDGELRGLEGSNTYTAKWLLVARRGTVASQPRLVRDMLIAYHDAIRFQERNARKVIHAYARHHELDPTRISGHWEPLEYGLNLDWSTIASLQQHLEWAAAADYPAPAEALEILSLIDAGPLRSVLPSAVGIPPLEADRDGSP